MSNLKVTYVDHMGNDLRIVNSARISFNNESEIITDKDKKLIDYLAVNEHMSPFEHNVLTVIIECPLYIRSQIHRHRTFSYNEISRRYTSENIEFFLPVSIRKQAESNRQASNGELEEHEAKNAMLLIDKHHKDSEKIYKHLLSLGVPREQARGILPQNLMTKFYMTGNLRNWIHFVKLRQDSHSQQEVQDLAKQVLSILSEKFPEAVKALMK